VVHFAQKIYPDRYQKEARNVTKAEKAKLAREKLASLRENQIACISVVTEAELRYGVAKSKNAAGL